MVTALRQNGRYDDTAIIISAKHGQSPIDSKLRRAIKDTYLTVLANDGYGFNIADDASLIWLDPNKRTEKTLKSAMTDLQAASIALGINTILDRNDLKKLYQDPKKDSRTPDFFVISDKGVIYTTGSKLAEHGGVADDDRHVAMLVSAPGLQGTTVQALCSPRRSLRRSSSCSISRGMNCKRCRSKVRAHCRQGCPNSLVATGRRPRRTGRRFG